MREVTQGCGATSRVIVTSGGGKEGVKAEEGAHPGAEESSCKLHRNRRI